MKTIITLLLFMIVLSLVCQAQQPKQSRMQARANSALVSVDDTTGNPDGNNTASCRKNPDSCKCLNARNKCRMKDTFIDKDKDGINDNRCNRMGWGQKKKMGKCCRNK